MLRICTLAVLVCSFYLEMGSMPKKKLLQKKQGKYLHIWCEGFLVLNNSMHLEFRLPKGAGGVNALYPNCTLNRELERWCSLYGYAYTVHKTEYCLEVRFVDERAYTLFILGAPAHFTVRWIYSEED